MADLYRPPEPDHRIEESLDTRLRDYTKMREQPRPESHLPAIDVVVESDSPKIVPRFNAKAGTLEIEQPDGSVVIDFSGGKTKEKSGADVHDANLAEFIDEVDLGKISEDLLTGIASDDQSRQAWLCNRARGIKLLATDLEEPRTDGASSSAPVDGQSVVRSPLLLEAVLRFQANARAEMLPSAGPVKVRNDTPQKTDAEKLAQAMSGIPVAKDESEILAQRLEDELNHFFTVTAREYYPDTNRMLFYTGFGGSGFKKGYQCPIRRRPVSESVDAKDIIVEDSEVDLHNAGRVTHKIEMRQSVMRRMQLAGQYLDIELGMPNPAPPDQVEQAEGAAQGLQPQMNALPTDYRHTVYECYCEYDIPGFEHEEDGEPTGLPLPYRVTIDLDSRKILEVRRRWEEGDDRFIGEMPIIKFPFVEALSLYGIGLLHILGNSTAAVTAAWRMALDAGMFASFPGFLYSTSLGRQKSNVFRIGPGTGQGIDTNGAPINTAVMPLPYHDATSGLMTIMERVEQAAQRVGSTAELPVGEGRQDAPVGTTLALIDQATKIVAAVHKSLHAAQAEEIRLVAKLLAKNPDCLICAKNPQRQQDWERATLIKALTDCNLVPASDPNTPSHMMRIMKAVAIKQMASMSPNRYNENEVDKRVFAMIGVHDIDGLFAPPAAPAPDAMGDAMKKDAEAKGLSASAKMMDAQTKQSQAQAQAANYAANAQAKQAEIASREKIATLNLEKELVIHRDTHTAGQAQHIGERIDSAQERAQRERQAELDRMNEQQQFAQRQAAQQRVI